MSLEPYVVFQLAGNHYAIASRYIQQVDIPAAITKVPQTPDFLLGVTNVRGTIVPVVDLRRRFGLQPIEITPRSRLLVIHLESRVVGLLVDSAREFIRIEEDNILLPAENMRGPGIEYLQGIFPQENRLILILDVEHLLTPEQKNKLENLEPPEKP